MRATLISHNHNTNESFIEGVYEGSTMSDIIKQGFFKEGTNFEDPDVRDDLEYIINSFKQLDDNVFVTDDNEELTHTIQIG